MNYVHILCRSEMNERDWELEGTFIPKKGRIN